MKYLYKNKIIDEMKVREILLEKGIEDVKNNISDYVMRNCNFEESDINIAINGNMEEVLRYLADYDIKIEITAKMVKFEGIILLNTEVSLKKCQEVKDKIKEIVYNLTEINDLGVKKLAYEIQKNKEAYYIDFYFEDNSENIEELEKYFKINDDVLKFIIMKKEE